MTNTQNSALEVDTEVPEIEWVITYKGNSFKLDDLTGEHMFLLATLLGDSWTAMTPVSGPLSLMCFTAVMTATTTGQEFTEVLDELKALKAEELFSLITVTPIANS